MALELAVDDLWRVVGTVSFGGVVGGTLYWNSAYQAHTASRDASGAGGWSDGWQFWLANAFTGFGGAWAALLALMWASHEPTGSDLKQVLELFASSLVAGYAGNKILPEVADRLTKDLLQKTLAKTKAAAEDAQQSETQARQARDEAQIAGKIAEVNAYLAKADAMTARQTATHIATLTEILGKTPTRRAAAFALAWLYWAADQKETAIETLKTYLDAKKKSASPEDKDTADADWNLAWYYEDEYKRNKYPTDRTGALEAISESIRIRPDYEKDLELAEDLGELRDEYLKRKSG